MPNLFVSLIVCIIVPIIVSLIVALFTNIIFPVIIPPIANIIDPLIANILDPLIGNIIIPLFTYIIIPLFVLSLFAWYVGGVPKYHVKGDWFGWILVKFDRFMRWLFTDEDRWPIDGGYGGYRKPTPEEAEWLAIANRKAKEAAKAEKARVLAEFVEAAREKEEEERQKRMSERYLDKWFAADETERASMRADYEARRWLWTKPEDVAVSEAELAEIRSLNAGAGPLAAEEKIAIAVEWYNRQGFPRPLTAEKMAKIESALRDRAEGGEIEADIDGRPID